MCTQLASNWAIEETVGQFSGIGTWHLKANKEDNWPSAKMAPGMSKPCLKSNFYTVSADDFFSLKGINPSNRAEKARLTESKVQLFSESMFFDNLTTYQQSNSKRGHSNQVLPFNWGQMNSLDFLNVSH